MATYYNEIDPQKAAWLRELIRRGVVAPGDVDERSIADVRADDLRGYRQCHFFAGIGIWSYALRLAGWEDERPVWTGSCPCPSFSTAGKGQGFDDPRHLWPEFYRHIRECRPSTCLGEQVEAAIGHGWFDLVSTDLEAEDYAVGAAVLGACSVGAPHIRKRLYFCADTASARRERRRTSEASHGRNAARVEPERLCNAGSGADAGCSPRFTEQFDESREGLWWGPSEADGPRIGPSGNAGDSRDSSGARLPYGEPEALRGSRRWDEGGAAPESSEAFGGGGDSPERGQSMRGRPSGIARHAALTGATRGFWGDCDWWYGKDGKWRAIERGLLPLAYGTAAHFRRSGDSSVPLAESAEARTLRLKGYGDAIVAEVAAEFIAAYMEARNG